MMLGIFGLFVTLKSVTVAFACGESKHLNARIVGGRNALPAEFPWQVLLDWHGQKFCGGSLISPSEVITAAHCVVNFTFNDLQVIGGTIHRVHNGRDSPFVQKRKVVWGVRHEDFFGKYGHQKYDIGIIKLRDPFDIPGSNGYIGTICLPPKASNPTGAVEVTGFGWQREGAHNQSALLQVATFPILPNETCHKAYGQRFHKDTMFCAADLNQGGDSCKGDSGGPAMQRLNGRVVLAGIVSWGEGCGRKEKPGVYTRVSKYLNWIEKHRQ